MKVSLGEGWRGDSVDYPQYRKPPFHGVSTSHSDLLNGKSQMEMHNQNTGHRGFSERDSKTASPNWNLKVSPPPFCYDTVRVQQTAPDNCCHSVREMPAHKLKEKRVEAKCRWWNSTRRAIYARKQRNFKACSIKETNIMTLLEVTKMWKIDTKENRKTWDSKKRKNKLAVLREKSKTIIF